MAYKAINYTINFKIAHAQLQLSDGEAVLCSSKCVQTQFLAISSFGRLDRMYSVIQTAVRLYILQHLRDIQWVRTICEKQEN